jgi:hypothetical protein
MTIIIIIRCDDYNHLGNPCQGSEYPILKIKQQVWFAAGPEVQKALLLLSDGGFRQYFYLCSSASRNTGRIRVSYAELAEALQRSRRSIACHFDELREKHVCVVTPGANQHCRTEVEICDDFWPYTKAGGESSPTEWSAYCAGIRSLLSKRACIQCAFTAADERFAAELFMRKVSLDEIEKAIALACCRKYAGLINGTDNEMIHRLSYFRETLKEVQDPNAHPIQADLLKQRILTAEYYERKWLARRESAAGAKSASTAPQKA